MRKCRVCEIEKELESFVKNSACKDGRTQTCKTCENLRSSTWKKSNPEKLKESSKKSNAKQRSKDGYAEKFNTWRRAYRASNPEIPREHSKTYRRRNPSACVAYKAWYSKTHRSELNADLAKYRAIKRRAVPAWTNQDAIAVVYAKAKRLSDWTGKNFQVDHIIPLCSDLVCGLHTEANLQILGQKENASKGNRYWPSMWT